MTTVATLFSAPAATLTTNLNAVLGAGNFQLYGSNVSGFRIIFRGTNSLLNVAPIVVDGASLTTPVNGASIATINQGNSLLPSNVTVAGTNPSVTGGGLLAVNFQGGLANANVGQIGADFSLLTGTSPGVATSTVVNGTGNEVQSLNFAGTTTVGDTFSLTFNTTTPNFTFGSTNSNTIQAALAALPSIGQGNVQVLGSEATGYTIVLRGGLGFANQNPITVNDVVVVNPGSITATTVADGTTTGLSGDVVALGPDSAANGGIYVVVFRNTLANAILPQLTATIGNSGSSYGSPAVAITSPLTKIGIGTGNEVQTITLAGTLINGGSYYLQFGDQITSAISPTDTAATIQSALAGLSNIGSNVRVFGNPFGPYTVVFTGTLANRDLPALGTISSLTGNVPTVAATLARDGGSELLGLVTVVDGNVKTDAGSFLTGTAITMNGGFVSGLGTFAPNGTITVNAAGGKATISGNVDLTGLVRAITVNDTESRDDLLISGDITSIAGGAFNRTGGAATNAVVVLSGSNTVPGASESQLITLSNAPTAGSFTLAFGGAVTAPIAFLPTATTTAAGFSEDVDNIVTGTTTASHNFVAGQTVTISGVTPAGYNGTFTVLTASGATFTYYNPVGSLGASTVAGLATIVPGAIQNALAALPTIGGATASIAASPTGATQAAGPSNLVTINTAAAHGFVAGQLVTISGVGVGGYNGTFVIASVPTLTSFVYANPVGSLANSGGGTATVATNAAVSAVAGASGPANYIFKVTFQGALAGTDVPLISTVVDQTLITAGTLQPIVVVSQPTVLGAITTTGAYSSGEHRDDHHGRISRSHCGLGRPGGRHFRCARGGIQRHLRRHLGAECDHLHLHQPHHGFGPLGRRRGDWRHRGLSYSHGARRQCLPAQHRHHGHGQRQCFWPGRQPPRPFDHFRSRHDGNRIVGLRSQPHAGQFPASSGDHGACHLGRPSRSRRGR